MSARKRRRKPPPADEATARGATMQEKPKIVPWRRRAREVLRALREWVRAEHGSAVEDYLHLRFGDAVKDTPIADLERAFDDFTFSRGTAPDGGSLLAVFADEAPDLSREEREAMRAMEEARDRRVYVLDRAQRDLLFLWDPLKGERVTVHLLERMARGYVANLRRGAVVVATTLPYGERTIALGEVETWSEDDAIRMFRQEVRDSGRTWHDLPRPTPSS